MGNPGNDASPLQLPSVHHNPHCDRCVCDGEENKMQREFGQQNIGKEILSIIYTFQ